MKHSLKKRLIWLFIGVLIAAILICAVFSYICVSRNDIPGSMPDGFSPSFLHTFLTAVIPAVILPAVVFIILYIRLQKNIILPLQVITERMEKYDPTDENPAPEICSQDEIQQLSSAFGKMSGNISACIRDLESTTAEKEYNRACSDIARRIQNDTVPGSFHEKTEQIDISALTKPANEVCGDFYDCFGFDEEKYCALIGDVSAKGIDGMLVMALVKNLLHERIIQLKDPAAAIKSINRELCARNPEKISVTLFAMILDLKTGAVRYVNAGHNPPVIISADTVKDLKTEPGIVLGLFEDAEFHTDSFLLRKDEGILLYTDGIIEAGSPEKSLSGKERLPDLIKMNLSSESRTGSDALEDLLNAFSDGCEQTDDMSGVLLFYRGMDEQKDLPVSPDSFETIKQDILEYCDESNNAKMIILACEEAFMNIVKYSGATELHFLCSREGDILTVEFSDNGICFDPLSQPLKDDVDFSNDGKSGLGIRFIRTITVDSGWLYKDGRNFLTLKFAI